MEQPPVDHDATADAGAQRQREVVGARRRPNPSSLRPARRAIAVVLHHHRHAGTRFRSRPSARPAEVAGDRLRPRRSAGLRPDRSMMPSVENAMPAGSVTASSAVRRSPAGAPAGPCRPARSASRAGRRTAADHALCRADAVPDPGAADVEGRARAGDRGRNAQAWGGGRELVLQESYCNQFRSGGVHRGHRLIAAPRQPRGP